MYGIQIRFLRNVLNIFVIVVAGLRIKVILKQLYGLDKIRLKKVFANEIWRADENA